MSQSFVSRVLLKMANLPAMRQLPFGESSFMRPPLSFSAMSESEPWMAEVLRLLVSTFGQGLLDVGVNLGQTLAAYKLQAPGGRYVGLEPNPDCVSHARRFAVTNGFADVTIVPAALSNRSGLIKLDFYQDADADSSASIIPGFRPDRPVQRSEYITSITGAELASQVDLSEVRIVKIDVEGAEALVLVTLRDLLIETRPVIAVEVLPAYSAENTSRVQSQKAIEKLLSDTGYAIFRIQHDETTLHGFELIEEFGIYSEIEKADHVLVPRENIEKFIAAVPGGEQATRGLPMQSAPT